MLGFGDIYILCAVVGCLAVAAAGVIYGAVTWNVADGDKNE